MEVNELFLRDFRNYREQTVSFDSRCNVIFGENAQGKTNLLEAVVYLSCGKSPRARREQELIRFEADSASLRGTVFSRDRTFRMEASLYRGRRRRLTVNGVAAKSAAALNQVYQTVFFCPDDLYLIREGAAARRRFLDTALCQLRPRYALALAEYRRAYEQKTRILRDWEKYPDLLSALPEFNEQMVRCGAAVIQYRARYAVRLAEYAAAHRLPHREDATNEDPGAASRNLIRLEIMPLLREINPEAAEHMARTAAVLRETEQGLSKRARERTCAPPSGRDRCPSLWPSWRRFRTFCFPRCCWACLTGWAQDERISAPSIWRRCAV